MTVKIVVDLPDARQFVWQTAYDEAIRMARRPDVLAAITGTSLGPKERARKYADAALAEFDAQESAIRAAHPTG